MVSHEFILSKKPFLSFLFKCDEPRPLFRTRRNLYEGSLLVTLELNDGLGLLLVPENSLYFSCISSSETRWLKCSAESVHQHRTQVSLTVPSDCGSRLIRLGDLILSMPLLPVPFIYTRHFETLSTALLICRLDRHPNKVVHNPETILLIAFIFS